MSDTPAELRYTSTHEWVRDEGDGTVTMGITDHAQEQLGDVVYVELPEVGRVVEAAQDMAVVESVKAASDIYAPVAGTVTAVNTALVDAPEQVNGAPYGDGWMVRIELADGADLGALLDAAAYGALVEADEH